MLETIKAYWSAIKLALLVVLIVAAFAFGYASNHRADAVQTAWDKAERNAVQSRQLRVNAARAAQDGLQTQENEARRKRDEENKLRDARLADALGKLRKRPARPQPAAGPAATVPQPASPGAEGGGCTGAGLFSDDAGFLVRLADLAQRIRGQRDACYEAYDRAVEELNRLNGDKP